MVDRLSSSELLGVSVSTIDRLIKDKTLRATKIRGRVKIPIRGTGGIIDMLSRGDTFRK